MIFKFKKHNSDLYNTLLYLSRNLYFYNKINLKDTFETRVFLMFIHFSIMLIVYKNKKINFPQNEYDNLFYSIENNLRELGFGDIAVNKKMKNLNKIFYDILLKINIKSQQFEINENLIVKYFNEFDDNNRIKYKLFDQYFLNFYHFCFELSPKNMIKDALKFKDR
jgi:cytochrome b pre-mRNA-processing protein 3